MKTYIVMGVAVATLLMAGCSSNPFKSDVTQIKDSKLGTDTVPTWFIEPQKDTELTMFAAATGLADDLQFSVDKATHVAKVILADKLAASASASIKRYIGDNGTGGLSSTVQKTEKASKSGFKDINVSSYKIIKRSVSKEGKMYRTYVLLELKVPDKIVVDAPPTEEEQHRVFTVQDNNIADKALDDL